MRPFIRWLYRRREKFEAVRYRSELRVSGFFALFFGGAR
jgi:hypothetical protein